jgi:hypothetical protein
MVVIRGRVDPQRALNGVGRWRHLMGLGRWNLEYTVMDASGGVVESGSFKADLSGCFVLAIDAPAPSAIRISVRGRTSNPEDSCTVRVFTENDVVNLPRRLYPCNGRGATAARVH